MRAFISALLLSALCLPLAAPSAAGEASVSPAAPVALGESVRLYPGERLEVQAEVNLRGGIIELLLGRLGAKDHETVLTTAARPLDIHLGLLLLGLRDGAPDEGPRVQGDAAQPRGSPVLVRVRWPEKILSWQENGRAERRPVWQLIAEAAAARDLTAGQADQLAAGAEVRPAPGEPGVPLARWSPPAGGQPLAAGGVEIFLPLEVPATAPGARPEEVETKPTALGEFLFGARQVSALVLEEEARECPLEDFAFDVQHNRAMAHTPWIFSGSEFPEALAAEGELPASPDPLLPPGRLYEADGNGSVITTYHDPATVLDNPLEEGGDDTAYRANEQAIPALGTPVTVVFAPAPAEAAEPRQ